METTKLSRPISKKGFLQTTVPAGVVRHFGLEEGDKLNWHIEFRNNKLIIIVTPLKEPLPEKEPAHELK